MLYILTEDAEAGFEFYRMFFSSLFYNEITVINTSFGSNNNQAGNSKFFRAVTNLIDTKKLTKNDYLFIAVDNLIPINENMKQECTALKKQLEKCYKLLHKNNIQFSVSDYVCWEELVLSFEYLIDFVTPFNRDDEDIIRFYKKYRTDFIKKKYGVEYTRIFNSQISKQITVEKCMSELLRKLTTTPDFNSFSIKKAEIGKCWSNNCSDIQNWKYVDICKNCKAVHNCGIVNATSYKNRLLCLYTNSRFRDEFKCLNLQRVLPLLQ